MTSTSAGSSPLFNPEPRAVWVKALLDRTSSHLDALDDSSLQRLLEDALYFERQRLERGTPKEGELERLDKLARALVRDTRSAWAHNGLNLVASWTEEIHGRFSPRVYNMATQLLPKALTGLLTARPARPWKWDTAVEKRVLIEGNLPLVRDLLKEATVILAPTHVSNLDSPLIGMALYQSQLPPFVYGAGLNLFSNPLVGWWLRRLGAYTVDRRKKAKLYKEVLKQYSVHALVNGYHSLFFPGGTRSRSGSLESRLKKGLLGTGLAAWQEIVEAGQPDRTVVIVPVTLSFQLVLEAESLIDDFLADEGKQRYIIDDDEFSQPGTVASFGRRVLDLDSSIVVHFGQPMDCIGNPISPDPAERRRDLQYRLRYICDKNGMVERDLQRDRNYTNALASSLVAAYPKGLRIMSTHVAAWCAWSVLGQLRSVQDPFRLVRVSREARHLERTQLLKRIDTMRKHVVQGQAEGRWQHNLPETANLILDQALDRFGRFHKRRALALDADGVAVEDPRLCLYYRNRLSFLDEEL